MGEKNVIKDMTEKLKPFITKILGVAERRGTQRSYWEEMKDLTEEFPDRKQGNICI